VSHKSKDTIAAGVCDGAVALRQGSGLGGKQVKFEKNQEESWIEYVLDAPATGTYAMALRTATPNFDQVLEISFGTNKPATVKVPNTAGLWGTTPAVNINLSRGMQTVRVSAPFQRGVAIRWIELKSK
jgi:hypothetical protein